MATEEFSQIKLSASLIKDVIVVLTFLASIAGIYIKLNEQVIRLEAKVVSLEERTKELKESNIKLTDAVLSYNKLGTDVGRVKSSISK